MHARAAQGEGPVVVELHLVDGVDKRVTLKPLGEMRDGSCEIDSFNDVTCIPTFGRLAPGASAVFELPIDKFPDNTEIHNTVLAAGGDTVINVVESPDDVITVRNGAVVATVPPLKLTTGR